MKMASIWAISEASNPSSFRSWLGTLVTTVDVDFPIAGVFLTADTLHGRLLEWLEKKAAGRFSIQHLADGRSIIVVSNRQDMFSLRVDFPEHFDFNVVSTSSTPERVGDFLKVVGKKPL